jgi:hypothetical protein
MGTIQIDGATPKLTIGNATAEDATILFDGNAQDFYIALDDSADDLLIGLGSTVGTTPIIAIDENKLSTFSGAVTVGVDDTGHDVKFFGATASSYMLWDESADDLILAGAAGLSVAGAVSLDGGAFVFNESSADVDFRIESNGEANMFKVDAGDNTITMDGGTTTGAPVLKIIQYGGYSGLEIEGDASNTGSAYMQIDASGSGDAALYLQSAGTSKWLIKNDYSDSHRFIIADAGQDQGVYMDQDDTDWSAISDERLKTDWVNISNAVDKIDTLTKVGQYKRKAYDKATNTIGDKKDKLYQGLSAQEIEAILPELISEDVNGIKGMSYTSLVPLLVKSIQELSARIKTLEA